ncbi:HPP family protein [Cupriavidus sp. AU9028]|uniref:HPP family protein n=1 Tax=Cupriavidus sp. AU9028 TaxID=2871157 RepID=UPI001C97EC01|nr:HPP family protein [Cupriavidus sp. AU9028]
MPVAANRLERAKSVLGVLLGIACTEWISRHLLAGFNPWFIAPMGACAVLLFAMPSSPLAQPWSIIGGNILAALIGVACAHWIPFPGLAAAIAVALSLALMFQLHCVHPPAGAIAVAGVFGGPEIAKLGFGFAVVPVAINAMLLLLLALALNNLMGRRYPHRPIAPPGHGTSDPPPARRGGITRADLDAVLAERGEFIDIEPDDLEEILVQAGQRAWHRRFGELRCADIMSRDVVSIRADQRLNDAWRLMQRHRLSALPVISSRDRRLVGLVSTTDLFLGDPAKGKRRADGIIRDVMLSTVPVAGIDQPAIELAEAMTNGGWHLMPVVDERRQLVGLVTQSDLLGGLLARGTECRA